MSSRWWGNADVISSFWFNTTCRTLIHELSHNLSNTTNELFDITTQHVFGEEAIRAVFVLGNGKTISVFSRPSKATSNGTKKSTKDIKKGQKQHPRQVTITTNNKDN
jgi:hypothetical protein